MTGVAVCAKCGSEIIAGQCAPCLLAMALAPDEKLSSSDAAERQFGDYILGRQIGTGGMGVVYEAQRVGEDRRVAIKLIRDFHITSATSLRRFTIEAEAAARLDHPNIVRIHEVGDADGHPYFSMDLIEGESLQAKIGRGDFAADQYGTARFMSKVARAVHHAHLRGVVHRDLKPANILIDSSGEPHLTDFGLAKIIESADQLHAPTLTSSGDVPGTPSYMSPEQVSGGEVSFSSDIYGLGAVLYALLTGRPPFQGATPLDVFQQIVNQSPARPHAHPDLQTICLKCLEKDPRVRYGSAEALAEDLENFAAGRPISARPQPLVRRATQWTKRNPLGAALIASLCLGLSVALLLLKSVNDQRREIQLDRDMAFDDGMQKISQIWRDPATKSLLISGRELGILAGRSPADLRGARQLTFAVSADDGPSSMAQRYARLLWNLQEQMERELGQKVVFHLRLLKRFSPGAETLAKGDADFTTLSAVDFLQAQRIAPGIVAVAHANTSREGVIFVRTDSGVQRVSDLRNKRVAFPDPALSISVSSKALLFGNRLRIGGLASVTNILDQTLVSTTETVDRVLRGQFDAGVTLGGQFERHRHLGLAALDRFAEIPDILAARSGLEPRFSDALQRALSSSGTWPEAKFISDSRTGALLQELRDTLKKAELFEQSEK